MYVDFEGCSEVYMYFLFFLFSYILLYTGLVTIYLHTFYFLFIYMMMMYVFLHLPLHVLFLSFSIRMFFYVCNLYFCFTHDALISFCLSVLER